MKVSPGTIRHWEKELAEFITVSRDEFRNRIYTESDLKLLVKIARFREQGFSLSSIKDMIANQIQDEPIENGLVMLETRDLQPSSKELVTLIATHYESLREELEATQREVAASREENARLREQLEKIGEKQDEILTEITKSRSESHPKRPWWKLF